MKIGQLLFLLLVTIGLQAEKVAFTGTIKNFTVQQIEVSLVKNELSGKRETFIASLNPKGQYRIEVDIPQYQFVTFTYQNEKTKVFISPYETVFDFSFDATDPYSKVYSGSTGKNKQCWNALITKHPELNGTKNPFWEGSFKAMIPTLLEREYATLSEQAFFENIEQRYAAHVSFINNYPGISLPFANYLKAEVDWFYEESKLSYFLLSKGKLNNTELSNKWQQYSLMSKVNINQSDNLVFQNFQNLLGIFLHYLHVETPTKNDGGLSFYRFANRNLVNDCKDFMLAKIMIDAYKNGGKADLAYQKLDAFKNSEPNPRFIEALDAVFGDELQNITKEYVPDLWVKDQNGDFVSLTQFHGKVVLVSLWASWCQPCIKSFELSETVRYNLLEEGVVLLNINIDDEEEIWKKALNKVNPIGKNVYEYDIKMFKKTMNFSTLPFYVLVDKNGFRKYLSSELMHLNEAEIIALTKK